MLSFEQWQEKSASSLDASQILIDREKPVEAVRRAYYATYQMVTGVLIKLKLNPREEFGNWSHYETIKMYRTHVCRNTKLGHKERQALRNLLPQYSVLLEKRYRADYGMLGPTDISRAKSYWRDANRLITLLISIIDRGLL